MNGHATAEPTPAYAPMRVRAQFAIEPVGDIPGNIATVLGQSLLTMLGMFYPPTVCKKANIVTTELIQNVMENVAVPQSAIEVQIAVDPSKLHIEVTNSVTDAQRKAVEARIAQLNDAADPKKLFADTLRARRVQRLKGGLGLMRLVAENKFQLSTRYDSAHSRLTVRADFALRGSE